MAAAQLCRPADGRHAAPGCRRRSRRGRRRATAQLPGGGISTDQLARSTAGRPRSCSRGPPSDPAVDEAALQLPAVPLPHRPQEQPEAARLDDAPRVGQAARVLHDRVQEQGVAKRPRPHLPRRRLPVQALRSQLLPQGAAQAPSDGSQRAEGLHLRSLRLRHQPQKQSRTTQKGVLYTAVHT